MLSLPDPPFSVAVPVPPATTIVLLQTRYPSARRGDLQEAEAPAGAQHAKKLLECPAEVEQVTQGVAHREKVELVRCEGKLLRHPKAVAVGEIGLDLFFRPGYHEVPLEIQERSLRSMLELAHDAAKPVLVHDRDAHAEVLAAVQRIPGTHGLMHCFSGDAAHARRCADIGFVASFSGIVTFPRSEPIQDAARTVAPDGFVVETDSPFLSPAPERGKPNLPERVAITAAGVARLRGVTVEEVRAATTRTARRVLSLPAPASALPRA